MKRIALLVAAGLFSQIASAEMILGTIDFQQLQPYITKIQQQSMQVDSSLKGEYAAMQARITAFKQKAATDKSKMTPAQKTTFDIQLGEMKAQLSKDSMAMSGRMIKAQTDAMRAAQDNIIKEVADIAKQHKVNAVFPKQVLLYTDSAVDLTPDLMKKLNK